VAGPSLLEPALPGRPGQPPWSLAAHPAPQAVVALTAAAIAAGTASLALTLAAGRRGWRAPRGLLLGAGLAAVVALALVPPFGSSDHLSYAAYGRLAATGHDPYTTTPAALARLGDPVGRAVADWRNSPSVYGALATAGQGLAALLGGTSARLTVFFLGVLNAAAFTGTGLLLHGLARGDRARQQRAALLWTANPLLLQVLVAGGHVDSQGIVFAVAAVAVFGAARRRAVAAHHGAARGAAVAAQDGAARPALVAAGAGALVGLGCAVKVTVALAGLGLALAVLLAGRPGRPGRGPRGRWPVLGGLAGGFAVTAGASLAVWGPGVLVPALRAASQVSIGSPWRPVRSALETLTGEAAAEDAVRAAAIAAAVVLLLLLLRTVRAGRGAGGDLAGGDPDGADLTGADLAAGAVAAVVLAWLFAWPYVLPWYDGLGWAALALLPRSRLDGLLLARTAALALGYLPGRGCYPGAPACVAGAAVAPGLGWLETVVRTGITPAILLAATVTLLVTAWPGRGWRWPAGAGLRGTVPRSAAAAGRPRGWPSASFPAAGRGASAPAAPGRPSAERTASSGCRGTALPASRPAGPAPPAARSRWGPSHRRTAATAAPAPRRARARGRPPAP
jgi:hypothetical protein